MVQQSAEAHPPTMGELEAQAAGGWHLYHSVVTSALTLRVARIGLDFVLSSQAFNRQWSCERGRSERGRQ